MSNQSYEDTLRKQGKVIVSLQNEIDKKDQMLTEMEQKNSDTLACVRRLIIGLVENINSKIGVCLRWNAKLEQIKAMNFKMNHEMECLKKELGQLNKQLEESKALNDQRQKNFIEEIQKSLRDMFRGRSQLGIKRMGELDPKPFQNLCSQKYSSEQWQEMSAQLCSSWEENLKNPAWHPFKTIEVNGILQEILDENDEN
ncbi:putative domain XH [Sesbania bispinosa]|nr:putative domain XH [Sesbania bispinosa]